MRHILPAVFVTLFAVMILGTTNGCKLLDSANNTPADTTKCSKCDGYELVDSLKVLHIVTDKFYIKTPNACNNCEAHYFMYYQWANPTRATQDPSEPPIANLSHSFGPHGELGYFPHDDAKIMTTNGEYQYVIDFRVGNKYSSADYTNYGFGTSIDPTRVIDIADSILIYCTISYKPY